MASETLSNCPCCGSRAYMHIIYRFINKWTNTYTVYWIECTNEKCKLSGMEYIHKKEAIQAWNRRV